ncbi:four helix bundle protein [Patescibacteria group bacterium]|nr:four helix bundle protein [Patescibacteria group bacterium]
MDKIQRNARLLERLIKFSQKVISLCRKLPRTSVNQRLVPQVAASSDSMPANYAEACAAESNADFVHKIRIVMKEANETRVHLRLLYVANPDFQREIVELGKESTEYIKIFFTIEKKCRQKKPS